MFGYKIILTLALSITAHVAERISQEDCELHRPTIHDFCCLIYDEDLEFMDCASEWDDLLESDTTEQEKVLHYCIAECTYNETEYLKDETMLDLKEIKSHLRSRYMKKAHYKFMVTAFTKCEKHAKNMMKSKDVKALKGMLQAAGCNAYAGLVMECVTNELIMNCPEDEWNDTAQCDHAKEYLQNCFK